MASGRVLDGRYELITELGRGPTGVAYAALDQRLSDEVVVKVLHPALFVDELRAANVLRIQRARAFVHDNIAQLRDVVVAPERVYIVSDRVAAEPLRDWIGARAPADTASTVALLEQVVEAMAWIHQIGVHGNLKPTNVFVDGSGRVTLTDPWFLMGAESIRDGELPARQASWLAPEQRTAGWREAPSADVHGMGLMMALLVLRRPAEGGIPLLAQGAQVPEELDDVFERATSSSAFARYPDARTFWREVHPVLVKLNLPLDLAPASDRSLESLADATMSDALVGLSPEELAKVEHLSAASAGQDVTLGDFRRVAGLETIAADTDTDTDTDTGSGDDGFGDGRATSTFEQVADPDDTMDDPGREVLELGDSAILDVVDNVIEALGGSPQPPASDTRAAGVEGIPAADGFDDAIELGDSSLIEVEDIRAAAEILAARKTAGAEAVIHEESAESAAIELGNSSLIEVTEIDAMVAQVAAAQEVSPVDGDTSTGLEVVGSSDDGHGVTGSSAGDTITGLAVVQLPSDTNAEVPAGQILIDAALQGARADGNRRYDTEPVTVAPAGMRVSTEDNSAVLLGDSALIEVAEIDEIVSELQTNNDAKRSRQASPGPAEDAASSSRADTTNLTTAAASRGRVEPAASDAHRATADSMKVSQSNVELVDGLILGFAEGSSSPESVLLAAIDDSVLDVGQDSVLDIYDDVGTSAGRSDAGQSIPSSVAEEQMALTQRAAAGAAGAGLEGAKMARAMRPRRRSLSGAKIAEPSTVSRPIIKRPSSRSNLPRPVTVRRRRSSMVYVAIALVGAALVLGAVVLADLMGGEGEPPKPAAVAGGAGPPAATEASGGQRVGVGVEAGSADTGGSSSSGSPRGDVPPPRSTAEPASEVASSTAEPVAGAGATPSGAGPSGAGSEGGPPGAERGSAARAGDGPAVVAAKAVQPTAAKVEPASTSKVERPAPGETERPPKGGDAGRSKPLASSYKPTNPKHYACPGGMSKIRKRKKVVLSDGSKVSDYEIHCIDKYEYPGGGRPPLVNVGLAQAASACKARGRRLCSRTEWRRGCGGRYPYGKTYDASRCNTVSESGMPRPVALAGSKKRCRSGWGTYDMVGNVAEWTSDGRVNGGSAYKDGKSAHCFRSSRRSGGHPYVGFRCCANARKR